MKELYLIMEKELQTDYMLTALQEVLDSLEAAYSEEEHKEVKYVISVVKCCLAAVEANLHTTISSLDTYIVTHKNQ